MRLQLGKRCQNIEFVVVLSRSEQFCLLESKPMFDYTKWVLNFGPDVRLLQTEVCALGLSNK